jgi:hypothetical protein
MAETTSTTTSQSTTRATSAAAAAASSDASMNRLVNRNPTTTFARPSSHDHTTKHSVLSSSFSLRPDANPVRPDRAYQRTPLPTQSSHPHTHPQNTPTQFNQKSREMEPVVTPPASGSEGGMSAGNGNGMASSQDAQMLQQLSHVASQQQKIPDHDVAPGNGALSKKRMADGEVKDRLSTSPTRGHSRNTSTISSVSTPGHSIKEVSQPAVSGDS